MRLTLRGNRNQGANPLFDCQGISKEITGLSLFDDKNLTTFKNLAGQPPGRLACGQGRQISR